MNAYDFMVKFIYNAERKMRKYDDKKEYQLLV